MTGSLPNKVKSNLTGRDALRGVTVIELIIAAAVFVMVVTVALPLVLGGELLGTDSTQATLATSYAREGLDAVRTMRNQSWADLVDGAHGLTFINGAWQFSGTSDVSGNYTRVVSISALSANSKKVVSTVTWQGYPARTMTVSLPTIVTNWQVTQTDNYLSGDWRDPIIAGEADISPSGNQGTDVVVANHLAYVTSSQSSTNKPDLSIFDVTNPANVIVKSSIDLGISNANALVVSGNYAYIANMSNSSQLVVVNVANPSVPINVAALNIGSSPAVSIAILGTTIFLGTQNNASGPELYAIDVTNPASPSVIASLEIGGDVNGINVFNGRAYLATSVATGELMIVNIATPTAMAKLGAYDTPASGAAICVYVKDEFNVYLGRTYTTDQGFYVFDASNPARIIKTGSYKVGVQIQSLIVVNHLAFLGTTDSTNGFKVLDVANPSNITQYDTTPLSFPQIITGLAYANNTIYLSIRSNQAFRIVTSSP